MKSRTKKPARQTLRTARAAAAPPRESGFSKLVGRWAPDPAFDEIIATQRRIDWSKWRQGLSPTGISGGSREYNSNSRGFKLDMTSTLFLGLALSSLAAAQTPPPATGPAIGERIPAFSAPDQDGRIQTLASIAGPKGAMLVFFRSADW
jgi:hypothetical protein